jgi:hypothetical protein
MIMVMRMGWRAGSSPIDRKKVKKRRVEFNVHRYFLIQYKASLFLPWNAVSRLVG